MYVHYYYIAADGLLGTHVYRAIEKEQVAGITEIINGVFSLRTAKKLYMSFSDSANGWTHGLDLTMDENLARLSQ